MRGSLHERSAGRDPLTRRASRVDLSPQAGRGKHSHVRLFELPQHVVNRCPFHTGDQCDALRILLQGSFAFGVEVTLVSELVLELPQREFIAEVRLESDPIGTGRGRSKKLAEQAAALAALETVRPPKKKRARAKK